jgi:HPt (histidine-containing phosphotransfer) domain-containing protein
MDNYISKPIKAAELDSILDGYATRKRVAAHTSLDDGKNRDVAPSSTHPDASAHPNPPDEVFDLAIAAEQVAGGEAAIRELAQLLREECPRMLAAIDESLAAADATTLRRAAHTLKGAADVFGAKQVVAAAQRVESLAEEAKLTEASAAVEPLKREVARLEEALAKYLG